MRARTVGAWGLFAVLIATSACSDRGSPASSSLPASLVSSYEVMDDVPAGGITVISFTDDGHYALKRSLDDTADEIVARESGTFATGATTLTLTPDDGGAPVTLPFQIELTGAPADGSLTGQSLHAQDFGAIRMVISFVLGEQHFHTELPAAADNGTDDAGVIETPAQDAGCAAVATSSDGIDVSHANGVVDWATVSKTYAFAYTKATEGLTYVDATFAQNFGAIAAAGMKRGAYHFFRVKRDPIAQADFFASTIVARGFDAKTDLPPVVDVERYKSFSSISSEVVTNLRAFIQEAQAKLGVTLMIYTGPSFWHDQVANADFSTSPLWISHYDVTHPKIPGAWTGYALWQYTETGKIAGVKGYVDIDHAGALFSGSASSSCGGDGGNDLGDAGGDAGVIPGACNHDVCTPGDKLGQACTSCTMKVCAHDPYCCDTYWGISCFQDVQQYCGVTCQ